ncbi:MAG: hypothetical protein U0795_26440 [Pirellulales bacterium]
MTRCERLRALRERFMNPIAETGGSIRLNQIGESIFYSPFIRVADLPARLGVTYPTVSRKRRNMKSTDRSAFGHSHYLSL